jgi:ZIP family zinc transporter
VSGALTSALWGALASAGTVIGALIAIRLRPGLRLVALVMAFGAGALLAAAAYELVLEAAHAGGPWLMLGRLMLGGLAFYVGDRLIERRGGRKRPGEQLPSGSGQAVFLGSLMDGVPESAILGMTLAAGGQASVAFLAAVFLSNVPEAMSSATSMRLSGRGP